MEALRKAEEAKRQAAQKEKDETGSETLSRVAEEVPVDDPIAMEASREIEGDFSNWRMMSPSSKVGIKVFPTRLNRPRLTISKLKAVSIKGFCQPKQAFRLPR
jgi:hypothetical protein